MQAIRTVIIDDEVNSREALSLLISNYCPTLKVVGTAGTIEAAKTLLEQEMPSIVFLDIQIGTQTIFELLSALDKVDFEIIFISAHENYAIRAVRYVAIDYLLKPIKVEELMDAVERATSNVVQKTKKNQLDSLLYNLQQSDQSQHRIAISTADSHEFIKVNEILYCLAEGSYTSIHLSNGNSLFVSRNLKHYEKQLQSNNFFRSHQSCLINVAHLVRILKTDGGQIEMNDGKFLPLAKGKKALLLKRINSL